MLGAQAPDLVVDLPRLHRAAAGAVDAQHDALGARVLERGLQARDHVLRARARSALDLAVELHHGRALVDADCSLSPIRPTSDEHTAQDEAERQEPEEDAQRRARRRSTTMSCASASSARRSQPSSAMLLPILRFIRFVRRDRREVYSARFRRAPRASAGASAIECTSRRQRFDGASAADVVRAVRDGDRRRAGVRARARGRASCRRSSASSRGATPSRSIRCSSMSGCGLGSPRRRSASRGSAWRARSRRARGRVRARLAGRHAEQVARASQLGEQLARAGEQRDSGSRPR